MPRKKASAVEKVSRPLAKLIHLVGWITGVLVALAVGFAMTGGGALNRTIPAIPSEITAAAGWIVVILTIIGAIMAIIDALRK